ncbi:hypothetical protein K493DRAFT_271030 [Basidiobolus meristosporus CBS 931.73]|uniref:[histone H3]-lysine(36) N-trimethyltransferase n=1 Tax=Basidiobolus meristosporus CBS 931.73 TaxID=1314790 RepID=A0A1Y1X213_9FUNG|nr:hypothetical protein K493DRAFT_271030 [Basidiobolus meristosporus CBS 931.73]|eukprot:ORX79705.1 hypothetical protein K493DRAFT_271030 [Basidiobolus meristosporus CBS 931.73]
MAIDSPASILAERPPLGLVNADNKLNSPALSDVVRDISEISILTPREESKSDSEFSSSGKTETPKPEDPTITETSKLATPVQSSPTLQETLPTPHTQTNPLVDGIPHNNSALSDATLDPSSPISQPPLSRHVTPTTSLNEPIYETAADEARSLFTFLEDNIYRRGAHGSVTKEEYMPCQCKYNPEIDDPSVACGPNSDCINRMLFIECTPGDCPCGSYCQNQRFQRKDYSPVEVIKTPQKGFGLQAAENLKTGQLVMEYIGEVVTYTNFVKRTRQYSDQGLSHFYFMSLKSDEVIDATKMGCLARFINHSCNPNCILQKWIVGSKLRMGIFTLRNVVAGEELTFDYKFERYGSVAQKCYCGEANCKGYIGGNKKSELKEIGIDDDEVDILDLESEGEGELVEKPAKPGRKRKVKENDPDYYDEYQPQRNKGLTTVEDVCNFVKLMLQISEKPQLAQKMLKKLEETESHLCLRKFIHLHGIIMLKSWLREYKADAAVILQILRCLKRLPIANRNHLDECQIEAVIQKLADGEDSHVRQLSEQILQDWSSLRTVYKIPKIKRSPSQKDSPSSATSHNGDLDNVATPEVNTSYDSHKSSNGNDNAGYDRSCRKYDPYRPRYRDSFVPKPKQLDYLNRNPSIGQFHSRSPNGWSPYGSSASVSESDVGRSPIDPRASSSAAINHTNTPPVPVPVPVPAPVLPMNWHVATSDDGKIYYYNSVTRATQWELPVERPANIEGVSQSAIDAIIERANAKRLKKDAEFNASASASANAATSTNGEPEEKVYQDKEELLRDLRSGISEIVIKCLSKYKEKLGHEVFKKQARKITHILLEKEKRASSFERGVLREMNESVRSKIKKFVKEYVSKLLDRDRR